MSEIEKLYENAEIGKDFKYYECSCRTTRLQNVCPIPFGECNIRCDKKMVWEYPEFTVEKQLNLIKTISKFKNCEVEISRHIEKYKVSIGREWFSGPKGENIIFEEALAESVNNLWQSLSEEQKQQIKEILSE